MPRNAELVAEAVAAMRDAAEWISCAACDGDTKSCGFCGTRVTRLRTAADALAGEARDSERLDEEMFLALYNKAWGSNMDRAAFCGAFEQEYRFAQLVFNAARAAQGDTV